MLVWDDGKPAHVISSTVNHPGPTQNGRVQVDDRDGFAVSLKPGSQSFEAHVDAVDQPRLVTVVLRTGAKELARGEIDLKPVRKWEIHLIHQTHLDIGYTHTQPEVLKRQVRYLHHAPDDFSDGCGERPHPACLDGESD